MIIEAIILAGGKGTRLQSVVKEVPKPMAPIGQKPFLFYQMLYLKKRGVNKFILSVGYKSESIVDYFGDSFNGIPISYVFENEPLGTGGGVRLALDACKTENPLVVNGDTFFEFAYSKLLYVHLRTNSLLTFSIKEIENDGRYGGMKIGEDAKVLGFTSKDQTGKTFINAGIYLLNKQRFLEGTEAGKFSLEDDFLAPKVAEGNFSACPFRTSNFIDIGIPEDYQKAQVLVPKWAENEQPVFRSIFLDRDGVLNKKIDDGYVTKPEELEILDGVKSKLAKWCAEGKELFIVTNQRGVGRGLMSIEALHEVHYALLKEFESQQIQIRDIKYCTDTNNDSPRRKPNPGMLLELFDEYPHLAKSSSIFLGDSFSDLKAGVSAGIKTCFITNSKPLRFETLLLADCVFENLDEVEF